MIRVVVTGYVRLHYEGVAALLAPDERLHVEVAPPPEDGTPRWPSSPDVIVVDVGDRRVDLLRPIARACRQPIVALGISRDEQDVISLAELGVLGFVDREAPLEELVACVVRAARHEPSFPTWVATTLLQRVASFAAPRAAPEVASLTVRERQIVDLIAEGLSNKEIAAQLSIEVATVKNHVHNILEKLRVSRRFEAVARLRLIEGGAVDAGDPASRSTTSTGIA